MALFQTGAVEVSPLAQAALAQRGLRPNPFFDRHQRGDWGEADEWLATANDGAARAPASHHPITSLYRLDEDTRLMIITARDRSRTRLLLSTEYERREVGIREGYAAWASTYDTVPNPLIQVEEPIVETILNGLLPVRTAADVGTGTGRHALRLARWGAAEVVVYDDNPEMLRVAQQSARAQNLSNLRFEQVTLGAEPLPAPPGTFDLLVSGLMLAHLPDLRGAVRECVRVVRPGGHLLLTDFHPAAVAFGWRADLPTPEVHYFLPNYPHTRQDYLDAVTEAGGEIQEVFDLSVGGEPYGDLSPDAIQTRGQPPLCLIVLARKVLPIGR